VPILGGIPIPPDPVGDVGPNHYVEMVNTAWAVFSKTGTLLLGPLSLASIWAGFEVPDCADNSGDPIVLHDQLADRWILTQFSTLGPTCYNCVAVSTGPDPTGSYFRYAFSTGVNFPDYPKYGSFGPTPTASFAGPTVVPVAEFDSDYPCVPPGSRNCIPQPDTSQRIDILSYRQRPTWRLAYRNFGTYESLVTSQSVEARPGIAGMRWYELRRPGDQPVVWQQGTYAPADGVNRWMGSIAQDKKGNMALGYSVCNGTNVFPGIRYTGRLRGDPANTMPQGEAVVVNGGGSQTDPFARWGDYTSMNVDPGDDCRLWYVNESYDTTSARGWNTRIAAVRMPGCG
jgi:hypothetical protein